MLRHRSPHARPTDLARLRVWIESLAGYEGVAGELSDRLLFASAERLSLARPAIADQSQGAETRQQERPARGLRHADLDRKRVGVHATAPAPNVSSRGHPYALEAAIREGDVTREEGCRNGARRHIDIVE
jgi:hypothetical protein